MANEKDIEHKVEIYLLGYFQDLKKVIKFQEDQFKEHKIELDSHIDYTKLFPFIKTAIDSVAKNDKTITVGIFKSLYQETQDFVNLYNQFVKEHHGKTKQLNQKMITDKVFWSNARRSPLIQDFFDKMGIEGKINLKSYMAYYLKRIKISNMKDPTWNEFLKQTLVML
jgi:flagellar biosynthesis chaperone FliJ